jgi:DNA (cytosine-5)-methyltransferase 1
MKYLSVCSGIEAATMAWQPLGWEPVAYAEIDKFPSTVLAHHYPDVPNWGDITKFKEWPDADFNVLVGGTPCQSFSVAGLRKGMADPRGNLALTYLAITDRYRPEWVVWENVPGVLSSNKGRDFGSFLGGLGELGYGFSYRVLDAQYFGLAQRRRRVFVVGNLGDWRRSAAVLFEPESLSRNPAPRRKTREDTTHGVSPSIGASGRGFSRAGETRGQDPVVAVAGPMSAAGGTDKKHGHGWGQQDWESGYIIPTVEAFGGNRSSGPQEIASALNANDRRQFETETFVTHSLTGEGFDAGEDGTGRGTPLVPWSITPSNSNKDYNARSNEFSQAITPSGNRPSARGGDLIAVPILEAGARTGKSTDDPRAGIGIGDPGDPMFSLQAGKQHAIGFSSKDSGGDAGDELSPTLRAMSEDGGNANGGGQVAVAFDTTQVTSKANYSNPKPGDPSHPLTGSGDPPAIAFNARMDPISGDLPGPIDTDGGTQAVALRGRDGGATAELSDVPSALRASQGGGDKAHVLAVQESQSGVRVGDAHPTLDGNNGSRRHNGVLTDMAVRRLTPRECERLQGFPDDYTLVPYRHGKPAADGPRYKALGNSMAVPVMHWIGKQIAMVESL